MEIYHVFHNNIIQQKLFVLTLIRNVSWVNQVKLVTINFQIITKDFQNMESKHYMIHLNTESLVKDLLNSCCICSRGCDFLSITHISAYLEYAAHQFQSIHTQVLSCIEMSVCYYSVELLLTLLNSVFGVCTPGLAINLNKPSGIFNLFLEVIILFFFF